ncbi:unnamed protein product [Plutella xylostella]|uniref:(diamondback moth) hypothetical protein n=1 Tax=Plutella xylostella TaxID=51655 RepID=A0A8S4FZS6_PLUXY|nr:unnamed protein product [Plutella xylostella]
MELLLKLTPGEEVKSDILPMLYRALEADAQQIQELCLSVLPTFASLIDYPAMKNALLPRIKKLCLHTSYISVRVNCLLCVGKLLEHLDKWLVLDEIIPFLPQIPSREPAVLMGILGIYKLALSHKKLGITKEVMATKVLPFLIPLCVENGLTLNQFNALMTLVKQMIAKVETEHRVKLEQLNSIQNESKTMDQSLALSSPDSLVPAPAPQSDIEQMFSGLGLDPFSSRKPVETSEPAVVAGQDRSLTLEDKQRIAQQQETVKKLTHQPPPTLLTRNQQTPKQKPVDLTSTLLQSNLSQLSSTPRSIFPQQNVTSPVMSPMGMQNSSMGMHNSSMGLQNSSMGMQNSSMTMQNSSMSSSSNSSMGSLMSMGNNQSYQSVPAIDMGNNSWSQNGGNFNNKWTSNQNQANTKQDWSAFESLLPSQTQNNSQNNNNVKKLSPTDMMDLLG